MNYKDNIFKSLNIKPNEEFKLDTHTFNFTFKLTDDLELLYKFKDLKYEVSPDILRRILIGEYNIIKINHNDSIVQYITILESLITNMNNDDSLNNKSTIIPTLEDVILRLKHRMTSTKETNNHDE
jgi:hypothetical protein